MRQLIITIKKWFKLTFFKRAMTVKAFDMVINDAVDFLSASLDEDKDGLKLITNIQYMDQLYALFMASPFLLTIVTNISGRILDLSYLWTKELGWKKEEIAHDGILSLVHPGDIERTREAYFDVESISGQDIFSNRYRCKYKTPGSFFEDGEYWVWLTWQTNIPYKNTDKYRVSVAKIVYPNDPSFAYLQDKYAKKELETTVTV